MKVYVSIHIDRTRTIENFGHPGRSRRLSCLHFAPIITHNPVRSYEVIRRIRHCLGEKKGLKCLQNDRNLTGKDRDAMMVQTFAEIHF